MYPSLRKMLSITALARQMSGWLLQCSLELFADVLRACWAHERFALLFVNLLLKHFDVFLLIILLPIQLR